MKLVSKTFIGFIVLGVLLALWGFGIEPGLLLRRNVTAQKWSGPPLRIAFFSDLHMGAPHITEAYVKNLIDRINKASPDLILIGGDLVINGVLGGTPTSIEVIAPLLKDLRAPLGVFAVLGNHDWWNDGDNIRSVLEGHGIPVLENQARLIKTTGAEFWLVGIGDHFTGHSDGRTAFSQITSKAPKILFMHDPAAIFEVKDNFFFALAGHMHGGQIYVPGIGAIITPGDAPKSWASGWVDFELGSLFVSKGVGTSIIPVRLNAPPEYVILDLKDKDQP